jgi:hypothetical protein
MFSLIHYFPRNSFTALLLPHTQFLLRELKTNKHSCGEVLTVNKYVAYLRRKNKYTWEGQAFVNSFGITSIIQRDSEQLFIREQIGVTIKNHVEFDINLDYSIEILDDLQKEPKLMMTLNNHKYIPTLGNIKTPILTNIYTQEFVDQYNDLEDHLCKYNKIKNC